MICRHSALSRERSLDIPGGALGHRVTHFLPYSLALVAWQLCICSAISTGIFHWKINSCYRNYLFKINPALPHAFPWLHPWKLSRGQLKKLPGGQKGPVKEVGEFPALPWTVYGSWGALRTTGKMMLWLNSTSSSLHTASGLRNTSAVLPCAWF